MKPGDTGELTLTETSSSELGFGLSFKFGINSTPGSPPRFPNGRSLPLLLVAAGTFLNVLMCAFGGEAVLCAPAVFPKESKAGRGVGGATAPAGTTVQVFQENRLSVFVEWEGKRAWIDRQGLLDGNIHMVPLEKASLAVDVTFQKPTSSGATRRLEARRGAKVDVFVRRDDTALVRHLGVCAWIPASALGSPNPFAKRITASVDGFAGSEIPPPEIVPSQLCPELLYEKMVTFEIDARITSLRHYHVIPPSNGYHTGATSWADFNSHGGLCSKTARFEALRGIAAAASESRLCCAGAWIPMIFSITFTSFAIRTN